MKEYFTVDTENNEIKWDADTAIGIYTLSARDANGKYADISTEFTLYTDIIPVEAKKDEKGVWVLTASNASKAEMNSYLTSISSVEVNGTAYAASGRGSVQIIDPKTGKINTNAKNGKENIFEDGKTYQIKVAAIGYKTDYEFEMEVGNSSEDTDTDLADEGKTTVSAEAADIKKTAEVEKK